MSRALGFLPEVPQQDKVPTDNRLNHAFAGAFPTPSLTFDMHLEHA